MKTEIYISVKDLIKECIRKIWIIIVAMVVFGILLAGFRYAKDKKNIANTTVAESTEKVDVEKIVDDLESDDYNQVMTYVDLTNYRDQNRLYTADAKLMKINPYKVDTVLLQYYVNAEDENTRKDMAAAYLQLTLWKTTILKTALVISRSLSSVMQQVLQQVQHSTQKTQTL